METGIGKVSKDVPGAVAITFGDESGSNVLRIFVNGVDEANNNFGSSTMYCAGTTAYVGRHATASASMDGNFGQVAEWQGTKLTSTNISNIHEGVL